VAVFTAKLISEANDKFDAFVTIFGEQGDTGQRLLRDSATYSHPFAGKQTDVFFMEAVQLGRLRHVLLEFSSYGSGLICSILFCVLSKCLSLTHASQTHLGNSAVISFIP